MKSIQAKSIRALGRLLDVSDTAVRKWLRHPTWPFSRRPPWDPELVKAWRREHVDTADGGTGASSRAAKTEAARERTLLVRQRRLIEGGQFHDAEKCQQRTIRQILELKGRLLELPRSMAKVLTMQPAEVIEAALDAQLRMLIQEFATGVREHDGPKPAGIAQATVATAAEKGTTGQ